MSNSNLQKQTFPSFKEMSRVFKSSALKEIKAKEVSYKKDFNNGNENFLVVSKYQPLARIIEAVEKKNFCFVSPEKWLDPFELLFYKQVKLDNDKNIHECCFACNDIENEEGFWNIWSIDASDTIVRVTYNIEKLLKSLEENSVNEQFYLAGMEYCSRYDILKTKDTLENRSYSIEEYLNLLCLKREAYKYENELRLFVVNEKSNSNHTVINNIDYSNGIITEITLPPAKPLGNSHPARALFKCMQDVHNLQTKNKLEELINGKKLNCKITQSALYCVEERDRVY